MHAAPTSLPDGELVSPAEYLRRERRAETKSEYRDGRIVAMSGASRWHNLISLNVAAELRQQLRGGPCETYANDMRVKVDRTGLYTYPDVVVVCGEPQLDDGQVDTLLNPTVIVEVLSPSTEGYDRGVKFAHYRRLETLREYVLVAQDTMRVEQYRRDGERWIYTAVEAPDDLLTLESCGAAVRLADIYERVELPPPPVGQPAGDPPAPPPTAEQTRSAP